MSTGLLIVTHGEIGASLLEAAERMLGYCPLRAEVVPVAQDVDPDQLRRRLAMAVNELDEGQGVLILTDLYGGTPSNVARHLCDAVHVHMVSGLSLPMLVRVLNYSDRDVTQLAEKACTGGTDGIYCCRGDEDE